MIEKAIAKTISILFHPILYPIYGFLLLFFFDDYFVIQLNPRAKFSLAGIVTLNTFVMPLLLLYVLKRRKVIQSLSLKTKEERIYPLIIGLVFYLTTWFMIYRLQIFNLYADILLLAGIIAAFAIGINFFFKISLHSMGAMAFSSALLSISYKYGIQMNSLIIITFLLTGLIASARLVLNAHKPSEVYVGLVLGFIISQLYFLFSL